MTRLTSSATPDTGGREAAHEPARSAPIVYQVEHLTRYVYGSPVGTSQHMACLRPRALPHQRVLAHSLAIEPEPAEVDEQTDYFGNVVHRFQLLRQHVELRVSSHARVEVAPRARALAPDASPAWEDVRTDLRRPTGALALDVATFSYASPHVIKATEIAQFARVSFASGRRFLAAAIHLMERIHREFIFDSTATNVATPVTRVLADRRGVCQDFAHFHIACLRSLGLAARYVSGYLLTDPPPGQPRLIGADASHAWVSVYCPHNGWVDLDPTNGLIVDQKHITVGWGRDYGDVSPLRGVLLGGEGHKLYVGVSVIPIETD